MNKEKLTGLVAQSIVDAMAGMPEIIPYLSDNARLVARMYAFKIGEAPDDTQRLYDEMVVEGRITEYLLEQLGRIVSEIRMRGAGIPISFWERELVLLWEQLSDTFIGILIHGTQGGYSLIPPGARDLVNDLRARMSLVDYARQYRDTWLSYINETTRDFVMESILNWQQSGEPLEELIKILSNPELGIFSEQRAKLIAVTEVTRLHAYGNYAIWKDTGYIKEWRWNTANDERVCKICGERNYKTYPLEYLKPLEEGEEREIQLPAHPRCRCWATPVIDVESITFDFSPEEMERLERSGE